MLSVVLTQQDWTITVRNQQQASSDVKILIIKHDYWLICGTIKTQRG